MALNPTLYKPETVQQYVDDLLTTLLPIEGWANVDSTLVANEGDTIKVYRYTDSGAPEEVAEGYGNSDYSDINGRDYQYGIKTVQDRCKITDEERQRNSFVAEKKLDVIGAHLVNKLRADVIGEWYKSQNYAACTGDIPTFAELIGALINLDLGLDNGFNGGAEQYKIFMSPAAWRQFSISLTSNVLVEYDQINGKQVPRVNGIQVEISDLLADSNVQCIIATNQAVRLMKASSVSAESEREANIRTSTYYARQVYCPYLEFDKKVILYGKKVSLTKAEGVTADVKDAYGNVTLDFVAGQNVYIYAKETESVAIGAEPAIWSVEDECFVGVCPSATAEITVS